MLPMYEVTVQYNGLTIETVTVHARSREDAIKKAEKIAFNKIGYLVDETPTS